MQWNHHIRLFLIILFYVGRSQLKPTKPLEQSPGEIEWEAWLLIHDNRPVNGDAAAAGDETVRRITPKSIFTVRPFNADNLPPCAEGYRSDAMGRCVKFIKIDQNSHLGFLVEKLNSMYDEGDVDEYDDEEDDVDKPTAGPLQFNIPFFGGNNENPPSSMPNTTDLSILLTPNIGNFTEQSPNSNYSVPLLPSSDILENITLNNTREVMINLTKFADILKKPVEDLEAVFTLITHPNNTTESSDSGTEATDINETVTSIIEQTVNSSSSVHETTEKTDQNEKQALFFFINESTAEKIENSSQTLENNYEKATEIQEQTTIEDSNITTEINEPTEVITEIEPKPENLEKKTEKITFPENPILPFPVDDEIKINRFVASYVNFPVDVSSGDYKSSFFNSRLNENQKLISTTRRPFKPVESFVFESTSNKPTSNNSPTKIIFEPPKQTVPPPNSRPVNFYNSQEVRQRLPEFNHRNRDRNLFSWLEQNSKQGGMSSDRLTTKYFVPGGNYDGAYRGYYRKTQPYNYGGKVYRQWNNNR